MTDYYDEMLDAVKITGRIVRVVGRPALASKGITVVDAGADFGAVQTDLDLKMSDAFLKGIPQYGWVGFRSQLDGSFSEEDDDAIARTSATDILAVDPQDGTGDAQDTQGLGLDGIISPIAMVIRMTRDSVEEPFRHVAALYANMVTGDILMCDGNDIHAFGTRDTGEVYDVDISVNSGVNWSRGDQIVLPRRVSYMQPVYDIPFMKYLSNNGLNVKTENIGGAGTGQLAVLANFLNADKKGFMGDSFRQPLTAYMNVQVDHKVWDLAGLVFWDALDLPEWTDVFGGELDANAAAPTLKDMWCEQGYIASGDQQVQDELIERAKQFQVDNPDVPLLADPKDYAYKTAIKDLYISK